MLNQQFGDLGSIPLVSWSNQPCELKHSGFFSSFGMLVVVVVAGMSTVRAARTIQNSCRTVHRAACVSKLPDHPVVLLKLVFGVA